MPFTYSLSGPHVIELTPQSTRDYWGDLGVRLEVDAAAQERANATGHACEVFDHGRQNCLFRAAYVRS